MSSYWQAQDGAKRPVSIDLLPDTDAGEWLSRHRDSKALLSTLLGEKLPRRFAQEWVALHGWQKPMNELSSREFEAIAQKLKAWTLAPSGTLGYAKAEVTLGGIDTDGTVLQDHGSQGGAGSVLHRRSRRRDRLARGIQLPVGLVLGLGGRAVRVIRPV